MAAAIPMPPDGDASRGYGLLATECVLTPIALITTIIRLIPRISKRQLGWDDLWITLAMTFRLISFGFTIASYTTGMGRHIYYLSPQQIQDSIKWTWGNEVLIFVTVCFIKISICCFIFRIKKTGWVRWFLWVVIAGLVLTNGACVIVLLAQCTPLYAFWDRAAGSCWDVNIYNGFIYTAVGYSIVSDLICTALPVIILWKVQISWKIKLAVCGLMSLGLVAAGCAAVRAALSAYNSTADLTWNLTPIDEWAFAEADVGIMAANLALSRVVYVWARQKLGYMPTEDSKPAYKYGASYRLQGGSKPSRPSKLKLGRLGTDALSSPAHGDFSDNVHLGSTSTSGITKTVDVHIVTDDRKPKTRDDFHALTTDAFDRAPGVGRHDMV